MSQNIDQIYTSNPASSMEASDLLYLGRSPYSTSDDFAIQWSNMQLSITAVGTIATGVWQGTDVGIAYGGTGVSSVTTAPTASAWAGWDANSNLSANNFLGGFATTVTAAGTTVLTVASAMTQEFTGSTTQTVTMPVVSTLALGTSYKIINNSSGNVTVNSSGNNAIQVMEANTTLWINTVSTTGTGAASWNKTYLSDVAGVTSITGTANQIIASASTGNVVLSAPQDIASTSSPTFAALTLTAALTVPNGGTGLQTTTAYGILTGGTTSTGAFQNVGTGTAGQLLQSGGASALPTWTTATFPSGSGTLNHMLRSDGTNWVETTATTLDASDVLSGVTQLNVDNLRLDGNTISSTNTDGDISVIPNGAGNVLFGGVTSEFYSSSNSIQYGIVGGSPLFVMGSFVNTLGSQPSLYLTKSRSTSPGSFVTVQNGDSLSTWMTLGDNGTSFVNAARIQVSVSGTPQATGIPAVMTLATTDTAGTLTNAISISSSQIVTLTNALPVGSGGLGITSTPSNGQIPIGNGTTYTAATLTAGTGISISNGAGTITISSPDSGIAWSGIAGTTQAAAVNSGYIVQNASQTTITLPATAAIGDVVSVRGLGAAGWILAANTGQTIKYITATTSSGGTLTSAEQYDTVDVTCIVANTTWVVNCASTTGLTVA